MIFLKRFHASVWLTALGALAFLTLVDWCKPTAFLWDDNLEEFWPWYSFNYEAFKHGVLPQIDFYHYLGHPYLTAGQPAQFYPPIYPAFALAEFFGRPSLSIEWLCWVHLAAVALVVERLARFLGSSPFQAMAIGWLYLTLPYITCSPEVWAYYAFTAFFLPLIFLQLEWMIRRPTPGRIVLLGLTQAFFFFSGALNYFALAIFFEGVYLVARLIGNDSPAKNIGDSFRAKLLTSLHPILAWGAANVLTVLWALPAFGPIVGHLGQTAERAEPMPLGRVLEECMHLQTFLCSQVGIFLLDSSDWYTYRPGWLFWGGSIFLPLLLVLCWRDVQVRRWSFMALLAVILSTSAFVLLHELPGYRSFRWPVKNMLFGSFFYVLTFAALLRVLSQRWKPWMVATLLVFGIATNVLVTISGASSNGAEAYPRFASEFHLPVERLQEGRTVLVGLADRDRFNPDFLGYQFASAARIPSLAGDDSLVLAQNLREAQGIVYLGLPWHDLDDAMVDYFSSWSVRYYFVHELSPTLGYLQSRPRFRQIFQRDTLRIFEDTQAAPLAYFEDAPQQALPLTFDGNEAIIDARQHPEPGTLSVSLVPLPGYSWHEEGKATWQAVPVATSGRMKIPSLPGGGVIRIRYHEPGLDAFIAISGGTFLLVGGVLLVQRRRTPKL